MVCKLKKIFLTLSVSSTLALGLWASPAMAAHSGFLTVRGKIVKVSKNTISIKTKAGGVVRVLKASVFSDEPVRKMRKKSRRPPTRIGQRVKARIHTAVFAMLNRPDR